MSMGQFVLHNLFTPIQLVLVRKLGVRRAAPASIISMVISFGFVGLWHRLSWTWLLWGVAMGILMTAEKFSQTFLINQKWDLPEYAKTTITSLARVYVYSIITLTIYFVSSEVFPV